MSVHHGGRGPGHISRWTKAAGSSGPSTALALDFTTGSLDARITASGGANGTRVNSSGVIVAATTPRFDYNPATLAAKGVLVEEARTNKALYSADITNAAYAGLNVSRALEAGAPDGTASACRFTSSGAGTESQVYQTALVAASCMSVYFEAGTGAHVWLQVYDGSPHSAWVTAATGVVGTIDAGLTARCTDAGGGWRRLEIAGITGGTIAFGLSDADGAYAVSAAGKTAVFWGAQAEEGSFATSYIPTAAATVTRTADSLSMTGTDFSSWYNQSEGTWIGEIDSLNSANECRVVGLTAGGRTPLALNNGNGVEWYDGTNFFTATGSGSCVTGCKVASSYGAGAASLCHSGGTVGTGGNALGAETVCYLGSNTGTGNILNGHILTLDYYNTRLPDATLQSLTT